MYRGANRGRRTAGVPALPDRSTRSIKVTTGKQLEDEAYRTLASFRFELRRFLHFSEQAAAEAGITAQQHQALLAIRAADDAELRIGALADQLLLRPHSTTGLLNRLELIGLVERCADAADARRVKVRLTPKGNALLATLAETHRAELQRLRPLLSGLFAQL
jgi:DNA-binding MarR family transcriptional regulator